MTRKVSKPMNETTNPLPGLHARLGLGDNDDQ